MKFLNKSIFVNNQEQEIDQDSFALGARLLFFKAVNEILVLFSPKMLVILASKNIYLPSTLLELHTKRQSWACL